MAHGQVQLPQVLHGLPHILCFSFSRSADIIEENTERGRRFEILENERRRQRLYHLEQPGGASAGGPAAADGPDAV